ncbi:uncharacterized protein LOC142225179 [Haematobia irritans]|uniref:uncharacterized protein LOC142225179 n=1 Tax=Haematobia irritans TaxID=7368 RepID=UPI003F502D96
MEYLGVITLILLFIVTTTDAQANYMIKFTTAKCQYNTTMIKSLKCSLRNTSNNEIVIDGHLQLAEKIPDFSARTYLFLYRKNMPRLTLADITVNVCEFLEMGHKNKFLALYIKTFSKYLNVIPQCPFQKDFNYTLIGFRIDMDELPLRMPPAEFKTIHLITYQRKLVSQLTFMGHLVSKPKANKG